MGVLLSFFLSFFFGLVSFVFCFVLFVCCILMSERCCMYAKYSKVLKIVQRHGFIFHEVTITTYFINPSGIIVIGELLSLLLSLS